MSLPPARLGRISERRAWGKSRRELVGRVDQGRWSPAKARPDVGDAIALSAYCGHSDRLHRAIAQFARAYADQTAADYERFVKAIRAGRIQARRTG